MVVDAGGRLVAGQAPPRSVAVVWYWRRGQLLGPSTAVVYRPGAGRAVGAVLHDVDWAGRNTCRPMVDDWFLCAIG
jgi:hypothetical protein